MNSVFLPNVLKRSHAMTLVQKNVARMRKWMRMATASQATGFTAVRWFTPERNVIWGKEE